MTNDEYIGAEEASRMLRVTKRMVYNYGEGDPPKVRTKRTGNRILFARVDVEALAEAMNVDDKPAPVATSSNDVFHEALAEGRYKMMQIFSPVPGHHRIKASHVRKAQVV